MNLAALIWNASGTKLVVAACQISHPAAGATDLFSEAISDTAFSDQVKGAPTQLFPGLLAFAVALIQLVGREVVFKCDRAGHFSLLHYLTLFRNSVLSTSKVNWLISIPQPYFNTAELQPPNAPVQRGRERPHKHP